MTPHAYDETHFAAGRSGPIRERYTLVIANNSGASEETSHSTKAGVRIQIRTWDARNMVASVFDGDTEIYSGSALGF